jgi:cell division protein FtsX
MPPSAPGPLPVPRRSFLADSLAVGAFGFLVGGLGFSWLASRSSPIGESFTDILWSTGIWSGLLFGVIIGLVLAFVLRHGVSTQTVESAEAFRVA